MHNEVTKVLVLLVFFSVSNPPSMHIGYPQARLARSCLIVFVLAASVLNTALVGVCHPFTSTPPARQCELLPKRVNFSTRYNDQSSAPLVCASKIKWLTDRAVDIETHI